MFSEFASLRSALSHTINRLRKKSLLLRNPIVRPSPKPRISRYEAIFPQPVKRAALAALLTTLIQGNATADRKGTGTHVQGGGEWDTHSTSQVEVPSIRATEETTRIQNALREQVHNRWYNIRIVSEPEQLALRGEIDSDTTRRELLKAAQSVSQRQVQDQLTLRLPIPDQEVKDSIARTLEKEHPKLARELSVEVDDGRAKFHGNVANHRQIDAVLAAALMVDGVRDVESDVTVRGRPYPRQVARR